MMFLDQFYSRVPKTEFVQFCFIHPEAEGCPHMDIPLAQDKLGRALQMAQSRNNDGYGVYFRIATLLRPSNGGRGTEAISHLLPCLYIEVDSVKQGIAPAQCAEQLKQASLPPTILVNSGGGVHAYWMFEEPLELTDENREKVKFAIRALSEKFGGDPSATDLARVFRVPGFVNTKPGRGNTVEVISEDGPTYSADFLIHLYGAAGRPRPVVRVPHGDNGCSLPHRVAQAIDQLPPVGSRHTELLKAACSMAYREKYSESDIRNTVGAAAAASGLDAKEIDNIVGSALKYAGRR
jgi:hypothetical protein